MEDTRSFISDLLIPLAATDNAIQFHKQGLSYYARTGATTTSLSCPAYTALPVGLRFTLDNSRGSGDLTLSPVTGTPIVLNAGEVWDLIVNANGAVFAAQYTAAPTS